MASAVRRLSPVSIVTTMPSRWSSATAAAEPAFRVSAMAMTAASWPSMAAKTGVLPSAARASAAATERRHVDALGLEEARSPDEDSTTTHGGRDPAAGRRQEVAGGRQGERADLRDLADDGVGQRMLRCPLGGGDQRQEVDPRLGRRRHGRCR